MIMIIDFHVRSKLDIITNFNTFICCDDAAIAHAEIVTTLNYSVLTYTQLGSATHLESFTDTQLSSSINCDLRTG